MTRSNYTRLHSNRAYTLYPLTLRHATPHAPHACMPPGTVHRKSISVYYYVVLHKSPTSNNDVCSTIIRQHRLPRRESLAQYGHWGQQARDGDATSRNNNKCCAAVYFWGAAAAEPRGSFGESIDRFGRGDES